jgi:hypothetical protein
MSRKEALSLDEFATAPRKPRVSTPDSLAGMIDAERRSGTEVVAGPIGEEDGEKEASTGAGKALRRMKRARMKGSSHFVNVKLDRDTKRRLKRAAFNMETSMQAIMEKAIRLYLDSKGF